MQKIVYTDGNITKVVRGFIDDEDHLFVYLKTSNGDARINKTAILSIKDEILKE